MKSHKAFCGNTLFCTYAAFLCVFIGSSFVYGQVKTRGTGNFESWDVNKDGALTREEVPPGPRALPGTSR